MINRINCLLLLCLFPMLLLGKSANVVWVLDPGHGGNDHGCETTTAMEKDINLAVTKRVAELIRANIPGITVKLTREYDKYLTLDQRCVFANQANAELFLSIHVNYAPGINTIRGTETFYGPQDGTNDRNLERKRKKNIQKSELMAWMMQKYYGQVGRPISRGVKRERYYVCLYTEMPAILTEIGFLSTPSEERYMTSKEGQEEIAQCIYRGLKDYSETVSKDKIQSTLASLRRTGGQSNQNVIPAGKGPEKLTDTSLAVATADKATTTTIPSTIAKVEPEKPATTAKPATTVKAEPVKTEKNETAIAAAKNETPIAAAKTETPIITAKAETAKTDTTAAKALSGTEEPEELDDPLLFSVQIFSLRAKLQPSDARFKGLQDLLVVERDGLYKYLCGTTKDYAGARKLLEKVRETFPDAFLVAYKGNVQIAMSDAIELLPK